ncbi:MAG: methylmalonyl-CoA mutase, partial [Desulfobacca sp.]|nr:methylmalonyl-CoA mutase [Desulfobacca sp.]
MSKMFKEDQIEKARQEKAAWERELASQLSLHPERKRRYSTVSDLEIKNIYSPEDIAEMDYEQDLNYPCAYPYTRGVQLSMYRGRLWTMRMFAGYGTAEETNARFKYLLEHGETGLSVAF